MFENYNKLNDQKIQEIAQAVGMNLEEYVKTKKDPVIQGRVRQDALEGHEVGVRGTPTIFINGRGLKGWSLRGFQIAIAKEMQKMGKIFPEPSS